MESFSNILFSSVVGGPSFVHSPHVPCPAKMNSCSYYLSILDPNIELPELSTKDIDDLLSESTNIKSNKESFVKNTENNKTELSSYRPISLIINSKSQSKCDGSIINVSSEKLSNNNEVIDSVNFQSLSEGILFKCVVRSCNLNFHTKNDQMKHFFNEHKDKVFTCISCKAIFKSRYSLNNHCLVNPNCKLKNMYRCTVEKCDKYFFNLQKLENHLSHDHSVPSISCLSHSCTLKFFDNNSRDDHVKISHCDITYPCLRCDKVFLDRGSFEKHDSKFHRDKCPLSLYSCPVDGCDKCFSSVSNIRRHQQQIHNTESSLDISSYDSEDLKTTEIKVMYACPLPECSELLCDKITFQSHFLKHFTGELPGDINALLPPDPPVPGLELHSKTFEANVDYIYQREETNLVQALDLVPDKLLKSLEWLDDEFCNLSPNSCLTSALILPSTDTVSDRNLSARNNRRRKNPYQNEREDGHSSTKYFKKESIRNETKAKYMLNDNASLSLTSSLLSSSGSCARTCTKLNSFMINLIKRRRVFLKERVGMMQSCDSVLYQPAARQPALKQVVHRIFNGQKLPNKYEEIVNIDSTELKNDFPRL